MSDCSILVKNKGKIVVFRGLHRCDLKLVPFIYMKNCTLEQSTLILRENIKSCGGGVLLMMQGRMRRECLTRGWGRQLPPIRPLGDYLLLFVVFQDHGYLCIFLKIETIRKVMMYFSQNIPKQCMNSPLP